MNNKIRVWCCPQFQLEVEAATSSSAYLADSSIETYPFSCLQNYQKGRGVLSTLLSSADKAVNIIIGGGCLGKWDFAGGCLAGAEVLAPPQCFSLIAPTGMVDNLIAQGAYLLTPGWLSNWREYLSAWGFDRKTARQFFQETTKKLVLLDSGVDPGAEQKLAKMGEYLDLPYELTPVGLDLLRLSLERAALSSERRRDDPPSPPDHFFADNLMVIDSLNDLLDSVSENEAVSRMEELFSLLFAPGRLLYNKAGAGSDISLSSGNCDYEWTESGCGFVVPLRRD